MTVEIICISKANGNHDNPHEAITHYHWVGDPKAPNGWIYTRDGMVKFLEEGNSAYVDGGGNIKAYCKVMNNGRIKFLQTYSDDRPTNNLLQLPECVHRS